MKEYNIVFKGWLNFWNWIKALFSSSDEASIKRLIGAIAMICLLIFTYLGLKGVVDADTWTNMESWLRAVLYCATVLLGVGALIDGAKIIKNYTPVGGAQPTKIEGTEKPLDLPPVEKPVI